MVHNGSLIHARLFATHLGMDARMNSQLNVAFIHKLRGLLMCLASFLTCYPWVFVQPGTGQMSGRLVQELTVCTVCLHFPLGSVVSSEIYNMH